MGELASTSPPPTPAAMVTAVLQVVFVDGERTVDLGTVTVQPSLGVRKLQAVVADRVGVSPHQISASLARPRRPRRAPLDDGADLAAAVAREGPGCYVLAALRRSRRDRRGGRSRRDRKAGGAGLLLSPSHQQQPPLLVPSAEMTILKRLPPTDLASLASSSPPPAAFGGWDYDYEAQLRELQRQREWYLISTASADTYHLPVPQEDPFWYGSTTPRSSPCPDCEAAAAAMRAPAFHWCVRDAVTVAFRSPVGPIERPKKTPSSSPSPSPTPSPPPPRALSPAYSFAAGLVPVCY